MIIACDLVGVGRHITQQVRHILAKRVGLAADEVMICCSHTHSGPAPGLNIGWGDPDPPYLEMLPHRIADAAIKAINRIEPIGLHHAEVPCEGIAFNREYDQDAPPLADAINENWRPAKPQLTDTTCHVLGARTGDGRLLGFVSYFGCHPVVSSEDNRYIHGDFVGVATNLIEQDHDGAVGLFLQGALGDVNSCVVHKPQQASLAALDVIAQRYARAVQRGIAQGSPLKISSLRTVRREVVFTRKAWTVDEMKQRLKACEKWIAEDDGTSTEKNGADQNGADQNYIDEDCDPRMQTVYAIALRGLLARCERGESLSPPTELHGLRLGPLALLGNPLETFQAIKRDVYDQATAPIPLVVGFANDAIGYAVDKTCAARGGYATDMVPLVYGELPFANIHEQLTHALLELDRSLTPPTPPPHIPHPTHDPTRSHASPQIVS